MSSITIGTPYADHELLYISSGYVMTNPGQSMRSGPAPNGDISLEPDKTNSAAIAWFQPKGGPYNPTSLVYDNHLYVLYDGGLVSAFDARTGSMLYDRERLPEDSISTAAPWACNGRVFGLNEDGLAFVVRAGGKFRIAANE